MLFNSLEFAVFLPLVLLVYWGALRRSIKWRNLFLLVSSYVFYGWWDYRFLGLIFISSLVDFLAGAAIHRSRKPGRRRLLLALSVSVNLGLLGFFKYFNFFADSCARLLSLFGLHPDPFTLNVILPVGISFYTFQTMTYTLDIYRDRIEPVRDPVAFFTYVAFFPQLVAGPIERAGRLLPQFLGPRDFSRADFGEGLRQILWGLFKKMAIADNLGPQVDFVFRNYTQLDGLTLLIGAFFFCLQIYCDFSGYSDIAVGSARLMGFRLMRNFDHPYFSRNIAEFWRRWHISLSTWFRDYLYIPLGGNRRGRARTALNVMITFCVCGLWHGANWTFVAWGALHGLYYLPLILLGRQKTRTAQAGEGRRLPGAAELPAILLTFALTTIGWIFFRSGSLSQAFGYIGQALSRPYLALGYERFHQGLVLCALLLAIEWFQRTREYALQIEFLPWAVRYAAYYLTVTMLLELGAHGNVPFLYFQF
ncbi:MAG: MBOAT family O-acyltransferase [Thermodesulfobacteriota bacterium]